MLQARQSAARELQGGLAAAQLHLLHRTDHRTVGIGDAADQMPAALSLGTQQCVSLVRALSLECSRVADDVLITARMREW